MCMLYFRIALAVVLARSIGASPVASLPGALSATVHSCLGAILAGYWYNRRPNDSPEEDTELPDDYPELLI
jgi:predicted Na+-dependent transporter